MMYALGDMDEVICLAGALCKTWALLFTGEFGSRSPMINANGGLTHVRREVWLVRKVTAWDEVTCPRVQRSLVVRVFLVCS